MKIYIQIRGKAQGPCPVEEVRSLLANGWLSPTDLGQYEGETEWKPLSSMSELQLETETAPPPPEAEPEAVPEEILPPAPPPRERRPIPWKPALALLAMLAAVGVLGYYAVVLFQKVKANPPKIFASIKQVFTRTEKSDAKAPAKSAAPQPVSPASPNAVESTANATPPPSSPAAPPGTTNTAAQIALIDTGVIPDNLVDDVVATATTTPATDAKKAPPSRRFIASAESIDPKLTPFGNYDVAMIQTIQKRWLQILEEQEIVQGRSGKVILEFQLNSLGRVSEMRVAENTGDQILAYLCEKSVRDSEPFNPCPPELRKLIKGDFRQMRFTFYY